MTESDKKDQLARYADALAECDHIVRAGEAIGVRETRSRELFRRLCDQYGWQAA